MEITFKSNHGILGTLIVNSENTTITEDVVERRDGKWVVPEAITNNLVDVARDCFRHSDNALTDVDFVEYIIERMLNSSEREKLIERIRWKS